MKQFVSRNEGPPGSIRQISVSQLRLTLKGLIQSRDTTHPAAGYVVKIFAPDITQDEQPLAQAQTDQNGYWSVELAFAERAGDIARHLREKGSSQLRLEVYEPGGSCSKRITLRKGTEWRKPIVLEVPPPQVPGLVQRALEVSGYLSNRPEKLACERLRIEVWDRYSDQKDSLAAAPVQEDGHFTLKIPADKAFGFFKSHPVLWLRVRNIKEDIILALGSTPLSFNKEGQAAQELCLPERLPVPPPVFNAPKRLTEIYLTISPDDIRRLYLAGIKTLKAAADMKGPEIAKKTGIELERLAVLNSFARDLLATLSSALRYRKVALSRFELAEVGQLQFQQIIPQCLIPRMEDRWEYRFTVWDRGLNKVEAANHYLAILGITPYWRNQKIQDWFNARRWWWNRFHINLSLLNDATAIWGEPFAYNREIVISTAIEGPEGVEDQIHKRIDAIVNLGGNDIHLTTWTGPGENDKTGGKVEYWLPLNNFRVYWELDNPGNDRQPGQRDDYDCADYFETALEFGYYSPTIVLYGKDGWKLQNWQIKVTHNGVEYTHLSGIPSPVWLDSDGPYDRCILYIDPWENPFEYWINQLYGLLGEINALKSELDNIHRLCECVDDILEFVLDGNTYFLNEDYVNAVKKYREAEAELRKVVSEDRRTRGYRRFQYVLSLHIGDCYWGHREYERAVNHFLTDTCSKRNAGTFDDHFLWNHVAACILDWADHRYRAAGNEHQKRYDFGVGASDEDSVEKIADPIDPEHPYRQVNSQGAHALYSWVLERCFYCAGNVPFNWTGYWHELFQQNAITKLLMLVEDADPTDLKHLKGVTLSIGKQREVPLAPRPDVAKRFDAAAAYMSMEQKALEAEDLTDLALVAECDKSIPFQGIQLLGIQGKRDEPVKIFARHAFTGAFQSGYELDVMDILEVDPIPLVGCDLIPRESVCETFSDLLLLRAEAGKSSIEACLNPMGLHDDYLPPYRFNALRAWAQQALETAKMAGELYISYKRLTEEALDNVTAIRNARDIADKNLWLGQTLEDIAQSGKELADQRVVAIDNQIDQTEEEFYEAEQLGAIRQLGSSFNMMLSAISGTSAGAGAGPGGAIAGGIIGTAKGFVDVVETGINTRNLLNDIDRRHDQLIIEKGLAKEEAGQAWLELVAQQRRNYIAELERDSLNEKLQRAQGDSFRNPEVWHQIAMIQRRLFFSAMGRAILGCWLVQKAIGFEIEVGTNPLPLSLPNGEGVAWRSIRFDYLDSVLIIPSEPGVYGFGEDGQLIYSPLIAAITGAGRLEDDFNNMLFYRIIWYGENVSRFATTEITFSNTFPIQLAQIWNATGRKVRVHFSTPIKFFDEIAPDKSAYCRLFYVQAFYESSSGDPNAFHGELHNTYVAEPAPGEEVRSNLTYWRVPDDRGTANVQPCNPALSKACYLDDWIKYPPNSESWILKAKPAAPSKIAPETSSSITSDGQVNVYNFGSEDGERVYTLEREQNLDFLNTFENTGVQCDWTLKLRIPSSSNANWSEITDIRLVFVWRGVNSGNLPTLIDNQFDLGTHGYTFIRRFQQSPYPEKQLFDMLFDPNQPLYTDQLGVRGNCIDFTIFNDNKLPGQNRQLESVYLIFLFDESVIHIPSLTVRLTKENVVNGAGQPVEIVFISPTHSHQPGFQLPPEFLGQDPAGKWTFRMLSTDNLDATGAPKSLGGLNDLVLVIEYKYTNQ